MRRTGGEPWFEAGGPALAAEPRPVPEGLGHRLEREGERRFLFAPVLFGCGALAYFGLPRDPSLVAVLSAAVLSAAAARRLEAGSVARHLAAALLFLLCGLAAAGLRTAWVDAPVVTGPQRVVAVEGLVERVERDAGKGDRITLAVQRFGDGPASAAPRRVSFRSRIRQAEYRAGDTVSVRLVLMPPPDAALPGGFDYARQAFFAGIGGTGYAIAPPRALAAAPRGPLGALADGVEHLRQGISARILDAVPGAAGAIAAALVTGDRSRIPETAEDSLRAAGLAHILAISGLHMMLAVGAIFAALRYGAALVPQVALRHPVKKWAAATALLGGTAYLVISGMSVATQRAYVMAAVLLVAVIADRPAITMRNVALAGLVILALRPEAVVSAGFQMSFAATIALVSAYEAIRLRRARRPDGFAPARGPFGVAAAYAGGVALTSFVAGTATAPFAAYHFHQFAAYGLVGNLAAMPVFAFLVMPAGLVAMLAMPFAMEAPFLWLMGQGIDVILRVAATVASLDGAVRFIPAVPLWSILALSLGGLWLAFWRTGWRWAGLAGVPACLLVAMLDRAPDAVIDREGRVVALRDGRGVVLVGTRGSSYEREQWLSAWGLAEGSGARQAEIAADGARAPPVVARAPCDGLACYHPGQPLAVSVVRDPAAFLDDCRAARLVVAGPAPPGWCAEQALVISAADLARSGAIALELSADGRRLRLRSASGETGDRPWNWRWRVHGPPSLPDLSSLPALSDLSAMPLPTGVPDPADTEGKARSADATR